MGCFHQVAEKPRPALASKVTINGSIQKTKQVGKSSDPDADSLKNKILVLQRQVIKARPHKIVNKNFLLSHTL